MRIPAPVTVEILGTGHFGRNIAVRGGAFFLRIFGQHRACKGIFRHRPGRQAQDTPAAPTRLAVDIDPLAVPQRLAADVFDLQLTPPDACGGGVVHPVHAIVTCAQRHQASFARDDIDLGRHLARPDAQAQAAAVQLQADGLVIQAQHFEFGRSPQAHHGRTHADLGSAARRGGDAVARGERAVALDLRPLAAFGVPPRDRALGLGQATDAPGRVFLRPGGAGRKHTEAHRPRQRLQDRQVQSHKATAQAAKGIVSVAHAPATHRSGPWPTGPR
jgi:hypothetical protein